MPELDLPLGVLDRFVDDGCRPLELVEHLLNLIGVESLARAHFVDLLEQEVVPEQTGDRPVDKVVQITAVGSRHPGAALFAQGAKILGQRPPMVGEL
jgi:hypothetical protein